jgi:hypothetical protein
VDDDALYRARIDKYTESMEQTIDAAEARGDVALLAAQARLLLQSFTILANQGPEALRRALWDSDDGSALDN